jgi:branched-chain amino acid aminotransferase
MKGMIFSLNGELVAEREARISPLDRGFLYGDGVYETVLIRHGRPYRLRSHLERLRSSASIVRIDVPLDDGAIDVEIRRVVEANGLGDAALRINLSRGVGDWRLSTNGSSRPTFLLSLFPVPDYPEDTWTRGWDVVISREFVTMDPVLPALAKTTNRLNLILAKREAEDRGAKEAILLNLQGFLTEATSSNVFFAKDGRVCTPSLDSGILEGVTRGVVMEHLRAEGYEPREGLFRPEALLGADEAFLTFTTAGVVPIHAVDGAVIGAGTAGPVTRLVRERYEADVDRCTRAAAGGSRSG